MGSPLRDRPLRTRQPRKQAEEDESVRAATISTIPVPAGQPEFRSGFRECVELYALHKPNRRGLRRILDDHRTILEEACMRAMTRENVARYEGFRAALKELEKRRMVKK